VLLIDCDTRTFAPGQKSCTDRLRVIRDPGDNSLVYVFLIQIIISFLRSGMGSTAFSDKLVRSVCKYM
jgi:hypothetical protein